jgi:hypothetical protein
MEQRKIQSKKRYLLSFIIGTSIFCLIFILTNFLGRTELDRMYSINGEMAQDIFKDKLAYSFFNERTCSEEYFGKISRDLGYSGSIINNIEKKFGKEDKEVLEQKKFYTLVLLEHLEFLKDYNKNCNSSFQYILFFYSNQQNKYPQSEEAGRILDLISKDYPNLSIYSFDINLESELIQKLITKYNITKAPTVIIDDKFVIDEVKSIEEVKKYLN